MAVNSAAPPASPVTAAKPSTTASAGSRLPARGNGAGSSGATWPPTVSAPPVSSNHDSARSPPAASASPAQLPAAQLPGTLLPGTQLPATQLPAHQLPAQRPTAARSTAAAAPPRVKGKAATPAPSTGEPAVQPPVLLANTGDAGSTSEGENAALSARATDELSPQALVTVDRPTSPLGAEGPASGAVSADPQSSAGSPRSAASPLLASLPAQAPSPTPDTNLTPNINLTPNAHLTPGEPASANTASAHLGDSTSAVTELATVAAATAPGTADLSQPGPAHAVPTLAVHTPVGAAGWARELSAHLTWMAGRALSTASLRLEPERLGPLEVRLALRDNSVSVWFNAAQPETRAAIEQALPQLRELLSASGLALSDAGVSRDPPGEARYPASAAAGPAADPAAADTNATSISVAPGRRGLIDTYA